MRILDDALKKKSRTVKFYKHTLKQDISRGGNFELDINLNNYCFHFFFNRP